MSRTVSKSIKYDTRWRLLFRRVSPNFFIYISQILDGDCIPSTNSPGFRNRIAKNGHRQFPCLVLETSNRSSRPTYGEGKYFSAFCQLLWPTGISTSTLMTTRWHFYRTVTQRENLEWKGIENICSWHGAHIQHMVFWHVFGSMGFLQLDEEKLSELNIFQSQSLFLSRQSKKESELIFC